MSGSSLTKGLWITARWDAIRWFDQRNNRISLMFKRIVLAAVLITVIGRQKWRQGNLMRTNSSTLSERWWLRAGRWRGVSGKGPDAE